MITDSHNNFYKKNLEVIYLLSYICHLKFQFTQFTRFLVLKSL